MSAGLAGAVRAQWSALSRRPMTWVLLAIFAAYVLMVVASFLVLLAAPEAAMLDSEFLVAPMRLGGLPYIAQLAGSIVAILIVVYASSMVGHEFSRGTLRTILLTGVRRRTVAAGMLTLLLIACAVMAVVSTFVAVVAGWAFSRVAGEDLMRLGSAGNASIVVLGQVVRMFIQFAAWGVLAFATTLLSRSLLAGIGGTLAVQIVGGVAAGLLGALGTAGKWAGRFIITTAVDRVTLPLRLDLSATDLVWVTLNLAVYMLVPTWWAFHRFQRMDIISATREA